MTSRDRATPCGTTKTFSVFDGDLLLGEVSLPYQDQPMATAAFPWGAAGLVSERLAVVAGVYKVPTEADRAL